MIWDPSEEAHLLSAADRSVTTAAELVLLKNTSEGLLNLGLLVERRCPAAAFLQRRCVCFHRSASELTLADSALLLQI